MDERCVHDLLRQQCVDCAPVPEGTVKHVYVTSGGAVFHRSSTCEALNEGQEYALNLGLRTHPRRRVTVAEATAEGRGECAYCFSGHRPPWGSR